MTELQKRLAALTPRERTVYDRMVKGASTTEIARELRLNRDNVKTCRKRVRRKMGYLMEVRGILSGMRHPFSGEPCSFEAWKRAEIERIIDKGD